MGAAKGVQNMAQYKPCKRLELNSLFFFTKSIPTSILMRKMN
jgi:hypothetical protein